MTGTTRDRRAAHVWPIFGAMTVVYLVVIGAVMIATAGQSGGGTPTVVAELSQWAVTADSTVPAGNVTFMVKNQGTMEHEMLVLKTDTPADQLAVTDAGDPPVLVVTGADKVDEGDSVGETGDPNVQPGETRIFVVEDMAPGHYALICNLAGHYQLGMYTDLTVTP